MPGSPGRLQGDTQAVAGAQGLHKGGKWLKRSFSPSEDKRGQIPAWPSLPQAPLGSSFAAPTNEEMEMQEVAEPRCLPRTLLPDLSPVTGCLQ